MRRSATLQIDRGPVGGELYVAPILNVSARRELVRANGCRDWVIGQTPNQCANQCEGHGDPPLVGEGHSARGKSKSHEIDDE